MASITYDLPIEIESNLAISPKTLDSDYFFGVSIEDAQKRGISISAKRRYIENAQKDIENYLNIKLTPQIISEECDFVNEEYNDWGYIRTSYPAKKAFKLDGYISDVLQIEYPKEWLSVRETNDPMGYERIVNLVPGGDTTIQTQSVVFNGVSPHLGFFGYRKIPNYWKISYCTGFEKIPNDIKQAIGYMASIPLFGIAGDLILGAGIASQSLGIDGLSQNISTTSSATNSGYGARITEYKNSLKTLLPQLKDRYSGILFGAM